MFRYDERIMRIIMNILSNPVNANITQPSMEDAIILGLSYVANNDFRSVVLAKNPDNQQIICIDIDQGYFWSLTSDGFTPLMRDRGLTSILKGQIGLGRIIETIQGDYQIFFVFKMKNKE